jgi:hypothetical protein
VKNSCPAGGEGVRLVVAEFMQQPRFGGFVRIGGENSVHVGPNDELIGAYDVGHDGSGKIGAIAAQGGDAAVGGGADEAGDDGNDSSLQQREKNFTAALPGLLEMRLGLSEGLAGQDKIRGGNRDGGDATFFERGGEKPRAEAFSKGREPVKEFGAGGDSTAGEYFVEKIVREELEFPADAKVVPFTELETFQNVEMEIHKDLRFAAGLRELAVNESLRYRKQPIGDALHRGDDDGDFGISRGGTYQACGVKHAFCAEKRTAAKLESEDLGLVLVGPAGTMRATFVRDSG